MGPILHVNPTLRLQFWLIRATLDGESRPWKLKAVSTKISAQVAWSTHYNNIRIGVISPICKGLEATLWRW
jgi:hypothetical protein